MKLAIVAIVIYIHTHARAHYGTTSASCALIASSQNNLYTIRIKHNCCLHLHICKCNWNRYDLSNFVVLFFCSTALLRSVHLFEHIDDMLDFFANH